MYTGKQADGQDRRKKARFVGRHGSKERSQGDNRTEKKRKILKARRRECRGARRRRQ